jgi:hypothetical protein
MSGEIVLGETDAGDAGAAATPDVQPAPLIERRFFVLGLYLAIGAVALIATMLTVHDRTPQELVTNPNSVRGQVVISHWLEDGYFHYFGLLVRTPDRIEIYRSSTGGYMVSAFVLEKLYSAMSGHFSWRLMVLHNQILSLLLSVLAGLLSFRLSMRIGAGGRLSFVAGGAVVIVLFTFPDNLALYWEMSAQAAFLIFALVYLLIEEWLLDRPGTRGTAFCQALAVLLMTFMEGIATLGFIASLAAATFILSPRRTGVWQHFLLVVLFPFIIVVGVYKLQMKAASIRFPDVPTSGSAALSRSGLDGDGKVYGDHLDIAKRRDWARMNWPANRDHLFRWKWPFILGVVSIIGLLVTYIAGHAPRIALEALAFLVGSWLFYAAVFSQAFVIHPYLYDVMLFTPLVIATFAIAPAVAESLTRRSGAIVLVVLFCAIWYSLFQMRLYALRYPLPVAVVAPR